MSKPTRRNKDITCVLCEKNQTRNLNGVCTNCLMLVKDGESFRRLKAINDTDGKLETSRVAQYWYLFHQDGKAAKSGDTGKLRQRFQETCLALSGGEAAYTYYIPPAWRELPEAKLAYGKNNYAKIGDPNGSSDAPHILAAPVGRAALLLELYQVTLDLMATAYAEGYSNGNNLLGRMVDGDLTVNEIVDPAARKKRR